MSADRTAQSIHPVGSLAIRAENPSSINPRAIRTQLMVSQASKMLLLQFGYICTSNKNCRWEGCSWREKSSNRYGRRGDGRGSVVPSRGVRVRCWVASEGGPFIPLSVDHFLSRRWTWMILVGRVRKTSGCGVAFSPSIGSHRRPPCSGLRLQPPLAYQVKTTAGLSHRTKPLIVAFPIAHPQTVHPCIADRGKASIQGTHSSRSSCRRSESVDRRGRSSPSILLFIERKSRTNRGGGLRPPLEPGEGT